jgi:hypothetical protein
MKFLKQISLLALAACMGLILVGCQPSDPDAPKVASLTSVAVTPNPVSLEIGGIQALTVTGTFSDKSTYVVNFGSTFDSSAPAVAKVDPNTGYVTALAAGNSTITAKHTESGLTATTTVTVAPLRVLSIAVSPATSALTAGATQALTVTATYNNATTGPVTADSTFISSDSSVATVSPAGIVTAVAVGTATITATHTASGKIGTAAVTVSVTSGSTGTCAAPNCTDFSAPGIGFGPFENQGGGTVELSSDPNDAANKVVKFVKKPGDGDYFGTPITGLAGPFVLTAADKSITLRVYSPAVGTNFLLKLEGGAGPATTEQDVATTVAGQWETLTFVMPDAGTYSAVVIFPNGRSSVTADTIMYVDELKFPVGSGGGGGASGNTGTCAAPNCTDFSAAGIGFGPFENQGGGTVELASDPNDAANDVVKFVKKPGDGDYFGTTITGLAGPATLTATDKTVTLRVYSPAVGTNFLFKLEGGPGGAVVEKDVATTVAGAWETLSFDLSGGADGTYATIVIFPHGRSTVSVETTMYIDELKFPAAGGGAPIVFASGYASNNRTVEGGEWGFYSGNFTNYSNTYTGGGFVDGAGAVPAADSYIYLVVATSAATTDGYMGIFTGAPGYTIAAPNAGVTLTGQSNLKIELGMGTEWFQQPTNKQLTVRLIGSQVYSNGSGGLCQILVEKPVTPTTDALTLYTIPLSSMTLAQACNGGGFTSGVTTLAEALAKPIGEIHVQAIFPQLNTTVQAGTEFPTGFTRGSVSFE